MLEGQICWVGGIAKVVVIRLPLEQDRGREPGPVQLSFCEAKKRLKRVEELEDSSHQQTVTWVLHHKWLREEFTQKDLEVAER